VPSGHRAARPRVEHLGRTFGGRPVEAVTGDAIRQYQLTRRSERAEAATINRETSALVLWTATDLVAENASRRCS
jgi:hypothetical protein